MIILSLRFPRIFIINILSFISSIFICASLMLYWRFPGAKSLAAWRRSSTSFPSSCWHTDRDGSQDFPAKKTLQEKGGGEWGRGRSPTSPPLSQDFRIGSQEGNGWCSYWTPAVLSTGGEIPPMGPMGSIGPNPPSFLCRGISCATHRDWSGGGGLGSLKA